MSKNIEKATVKRNEFRIDKTDVKALEQSKKNPYSGVTYDKSRKMWKATITFKKRFTIWVDTMILMKLLKVRKNAEQALFDDFLEWYYHEFKSKKPRSIRPRLKLYISFIDAKILVTVTYNTMSTNYD